MTCLTPRLMRALLFFHRYPSLFIASPATTLPFPKFAAFPALLLPPARPLGSQALRSLDFVVDAEDQVPRSPRPKEKARKGQTSWSAAADNFFSKQKVADGDVALNKVDVINEEERVVAALSNGGKGSSYNYGRRASFGQDRATVRVPKGRPWNSSYGKKIVNLGERSSETRRFGNFQYTRSLKERERSYKNVEEDNIARSEGERREWSAAADNSFSRQKVTDGNVGLNEVDEKKEDEERVEAALSNGGKGSSYNYGRRASVGQDRATVRVSKGRSWNTSYGKIVNLGERSSDTRRFGNFQYNRSLKERERSYKNVEKDNITRSEDERREWGKSLSTVPPNLKGEAIYGVGPINAALQVCRREVHCLYIQENMSLDGKSGKKKDKKAVAWIVQNATSQGVAVKEISKHDLNMIVDNRPHQGLVLDVSPLELILINSLEPPCHDGQQAPVWIALDEVTDPQNFGAVLRSAYFLGASGVVVCAKNSAPLTGVVSKASAGALEVMEIRSCRNMVKFLEKSVENGWRTLGTSSRSSAIPVRDLPRGLPTILVLGSEGKGMRTNVRRACGQMVSIPGLVSSRQIDLESYVENEQLLEGEVDEINFDDDGNTFEDEISESVRRKGEGFVAVESLNVSVAAGILLHELLNCTVPHAGSSSSSASSSALHSTPGIADAHV